MNRKINIILITILIASITITTLFFYQWLKKERQLTSLRESFRVCQNLENLAWDIDIWSLVSEKVPERESSLHCLSTHDIYFCNLIDDEKEKLLCEDTFYILKAAKENNLAYCEKAEKLKLICQAILKKDESLCEEAELEVNPSPFIGLGVCEAVVKEDEKECENLEEIGIQKCKDNLYHLLAILKKDIALCDKISYKRGAQIFCRGILDINECLKYRTEVECPEIYLPQMAKLTKDSSVCEKIPYKDEDDRGKFFYQICLETTK